MTSFENLLYQLTDVKVVAPDIPYTSYFPLDLSINNIALAKSSPKTSEDFENFIYEFLNHCYPKVLRKTQNPFVSPCK
jgi:hypothetical protein